MLQILALGSVGIGLLFSVLFHMGTKERVVTQSNIGDDANNIQVNRTSEGRMGIIDWLKEPQFYQVRLYIDILMSRIVLCVITTCALSCIFKCVCNIVFVDVLFIDRSVVHVHASCCQSEPGLSAILHNGLAGHAKGLRCCVQL